MTFMQTEPNWNLVTDAYEEPENFADLFSLLIPERPKGEGKERTILAWKEKEFYKKENLIPFILYGMKRLHDLPKFHKDEMPTLVRIVRLCQEVGWYQEAYRFMVAEGLEEFVQTSLEYESWDVFTQVVAWNYLIIKQKVAELESNDYFIWERIKFNVECIEKYKVLLSHKEMFEFMLLYLCKQAKTLSKEQLDENLMGLAIYCNTYIYDLYTLDLLKKYRKCTDFLTYYEPSRAVVACQHAVIAQISDHLNPLKTTHVDDYLFVIKEIMEYMSFEFMKKYEHFIGKLLSYVPFFEMIQVPQHVYYCEELMYICKGIGYKEELLRHYIFIQLLNCFPSFIKQFLKNKRYASIHDILFYWCSDEQRMNLEQKYNLSFIYEQYACG
ncbi:DUF3965 domain-containing protein [Bacillus sp. CGMCC 1.60114]|uniref:DUF3965 domain-containing protein n=1 Tax=unclassified Bacillus (in: firmicutes) TaxID=185979 RepID=UPI003643E1BD